MEKKKSKVLRFRVSDEDWDLLMEKSKSYPSFSSFILDAAKNYDDRIGRNKLDTMIQWSDKYVQWEAAIGKIGGNINQLAHYANQCLKVGVVNEDILRENLSFFEDWKKLIKEYIETNKSLVRHIKK